MTKVVGEEHAGLAMTRGVGRVRDGYIYIKALCHCEERLGLEA